MADNVITSHATAADIAPLLIQKKMLERGEENLLMARWAMPADLPQGNGKTIQFNRFERLVLPDTPLTEGVTPDGRGITMSYVQAVVDQWGDFACVSDVQGLTATHPLMSEIPDLQGEQREEVTDREIQRVLLGGTNVTYANSKTSRSALLATDVLTSNDIRKIIARLRQNGARTFSGGNYVGVIDPSVEQDLNADATFVEAASFQEATRLGGGGLLSAKIGTWLGVDWYRSNFLPVITQLTGIASTDAAAAGGETGFAASSTVRVKVTKLDPRTRMEVAVSDEEDVTDGSAFIVEVAFTAATTGTGTFNIYVSMQDGASGTATFQRRVTITGNATYRFIKAGTPSTALTSVVTATGAVAPPDATSVTSVHTSYIFGRQAYGHTKLNGGLKTTMTKGEATPSDPLAQRRYFGWKQIQKAVILNPAFFRRVESASAYGVS